MSEFADSRPQRLCLKCGLCCRVVTASAPHGELLQLTKEGNKSAIEFLSIFEPYPSIEDARNISAETVDNILNAKNLSGEKADKITFYKCKYLQDNNLCEIYERRPELCLRFPSSAWAVSPPKCGFNGWLFNEREKIKKQVREYKELCIELKAELKETDNPEIIRRNEEAIKKIEEIVEYYSKYGSEHW